ncbi:MAG: T9SS type A sorting domain-containing protein, partial [Sphingobacteriia bacterium]|nr:T9SS type A sorting domain-containing protein [Sphingobacteriia bacterium]
PDAADIAAGNVTLTLTAYGLGGVCDHVVTSMVLTIYANPVADAGDDAEICSSDESYYLADAQAFNFTNIQWSTSGTGTFNDTGAVTPTYTPSLSDINTGQVQLTMLVNGDGGYHSDFMVLTIWKAAYADAGADAAIGTGASYQVLDAVALNYESLSWTLTGDGALSGANTLYPTFIPDLNQTGIVTLTLTVIPEGNGVCGVVSDAMNIAIGESPSISLEKKTSGTTLNSNGSATVSFEFTVENNGNVNLSSLSIVDDLVAQFSGGCTQTITIDNISSPNLGVNTSYDGYLDTELLSTSNTLLVGEIKSVYLTVTLDDCAALQTYFENTATATGTSQGGALVGDTDNCDVYLIENPSIGLAKQLVSLVYNQNGTYTALFNLRVKNYGDVELTDIDLVDDLDNVLGNGNYQVISLYSEKFGVNVSYNGGTITNVLTTDNSLEVGASGAVLLMVDIFSTGVYTNTASVSANTPRGGFVQDISHDGADPAPGGGNDPNNYSDSTIIVADECIPASAFAGPDAEVCAGSAFQIVGALAENYEILQWSTTGDGTFNSSIILLPVYTPGENDLAFGSVQLTLTANSFAPCLPSVSSMTLTLTSPPSANAGQDASICNTDDSYHIYDAIAADYYSVKWSTSGTGNFDDIGNITATYYPSIGDIYNGQVILTLTAFANGSCESVSDDMVLSLFPAPESNAGPDDAICSSETSYYIDKSFAAHFESIYWTSSGNGHFGTTTNTINATYYPDAGDIANGTVILTIHAVGFGTCAEVTDELILTIAQAPVALILNVENHQLDLCNETMYVLEGLPVENASIHWSVEPSGVNAPHIFDPDESTTIIWFKSVPGSYTFTYTVTIGACSSTDYVIVNNWEQMICCISAGPDINACDVESIMMNATMPLVGTGLWSQIDGPINANIVDPYDPLTEVNNLEPGSYTFRWANGNGPTCDTICDYMYVNISNSATAYAGSDATICQSYTHKLDEATADNYTTLQWSTSGSGTFDNKFIINPVYTPSPLDIINGFVELTITAVSTSPCSPVESLMMLTIQAPALLDAVDDNFGPVNGYDGINNAGVAYDNDLMNGLPIDVDTLSVSLISPAIPLYAGSPVPVFDPVTGIVEVDEQTPAGIYTIVYELCENLCPHNCNQGTIYVNIAPATIVANDDDFTAVPINGKDGGSPGVVLSNDLLNGVAVNLSEITVDIYDDGGLTGVTLGSVDGSLIIPAATPPGIYTITYQICEKLNPTNCDNGFVSVYVTEIIANADDFSSVPVNGYDGGIAGNLLTNDLVDQKVIDPAAVTITLQNNGGMTGAAIDTYGNLSFPAQTEAGIYTLTYQICLVVNPSYCDGASVTVLVNAAVISAVPDFILDVNGYTGQSAVVNVLSNDLLNGTSLIPSQVSLTLSIDDPFGALTLNPDGTVDVAPQTPAGTYSLTYRICELLNPDNCSEATVTIGVIPATLVANEDTFASINGYDGGIPGNVLTNDLLNGVAVLPGQVTATITDNGGIDGVYTDSDGNLHIPGQTPAGTYTVTYQLCELLNPTNCDQASILVIVEAAPIVANDDSAGPFNGHNGGVAVDNVLQNDLLNNYTPTGALVEISVINAAANPNVYLDTSSGEVIVLPCTSAGVYTIVYEICERLNPDNCDQALITVDVTGTIPLEFVDNPTSACVGQINTYTLVDNLVGTVSWTITKGEIISSTTNTVTVSWDNSYQPGIGVLTGYQSANGCVIPTVFNFDLIQRIDPLSEITGDMSVYAYSNETFTIDPIVEGNTYYWSVTGGSIVGSTTSATVTVEWGSGTYPLVEPGGLLTVVVSSPIASGNSASCDVGTFTQTVMIKPNLLAGQVKYYNADETSIQSPFTTNYYGMTVPDYFYVSLVTSNFDTVSENPYYGQNVLDVQLVKPFYADPPGNPYDIWSYFRFDYNINPFEEYRVIIWDGGYFNEPQVLDGVLGQTWTWNSWGGVNATDALLIQHMAVTNSIHLFPNMSHIAPNTANPPYGFYAFNVADVNATTNHTALDALLTARRAVGLINQFPNNKPNFEVAGLFVDSNDFNTNNIFGNVLPDIKFTKRETASYYWSAPAIEHNYYTNPVSFTTGDKYLNIYYNSVADINSNYQPVYGGFKSESKVKLVYDGIMQVNKADIVEIPLRIDRAVELGAITMGLNYNTSLIEIIDSDWEVMYNDSESGVLRLAWADQTGTQLYPDDEVIILTLRIVGDLTSSMKLFTLDNSTEFSTTKAERIEELNLKVAALTTEQTAGELFVTVYPNPFSSVTMFSYSLPENGKVELLIFNNMGQVVETLISEYQTAGTYEVKYNKTNLKSGVYRCKLMLNGTKQQHAKSISVIKAQ